MVIFDIMASHFSMMRWHEAGLSQHKAELVTVQAAKSACKQRLRQQHSQTTASADSSISQPGSPALSAASALSGTAPHAAALQAASDTQQQPIPESPGHAIGQHNNAMPSLQPSTIVQPAVSPQLQSPQLQSPGVAQNKMSVHFDSSTSATAPQEVAEQQHAPHHSMYLRAHTAHEQSQAGQAPGVKSEEQKLRAQLAVRHQPLHVSL